MRVTRWWFRARDRVCRTAEVGVRSILRDRSEDACTVWHHRGSGLKLQEGRVRRGLSARLGQQAGEDSLPWRVGGRVVPCRHPSAAPE